MLVLLNVLTTQVRTEERCTHNLKLQLSKVADFYFPIYSGLSRHVQNFIFQCILDYLDTSRILFSNVFWIIWTRPEFYFQMNSGLSGHVQNFIFQCILEYLDTSRILFSNVFWIIWTRPDCYFQLPPAPLLPGRNCHLAAAACLHGHWST